MEDGAAASVPDLGAASVLQMMRLGGASPLGISKQTSAGEWKKGDAGLKAVEDLEIMQVPNVIWTVNPLTGDREARFPYIYSQRHDKGHCPFTPKEFKQMFKKVVCFGCRCRTIGISPEDGVTGSILDTRFHNLLCSSCVADITRVKAQIESHRRACRVYMPLPVTKLLDRYPWWERYRLKGSPDSAIRLVSSFIIPDPDIWQVFQEAQVFEDEAENNPKRNCLIAHRYLSLLHNHLTAIFPRPSKPAEDADTLGLDPVGVILEYAHPLRMVCIAVGIDCGIEDGTPASDLFGEGVIWYPHLDVARLEMVPGWSKACHQLLQKLPRELLVALCNTDGHRALNQVWRSTIKLQTNESAPFHDADFANTHEQ